MERLFICGVRLTPETFFCFVVSLFFFFFFSPSTYVYTPSLIYLFTTSSSLCLTFIWPPDHIWPLLLLGLHAGKAATNKSRMSIAAIIHRLKKDADLLDKERWDEVFLGAGVDNSQAGLSILLYLFKRQQHERTLKMMQTYSILLCSSAADFFFFPSALQQFLFMFRVWL